MTLVEFLGQRLDEDEADARAAAEFAPGQWASWNRSWDTDPVRDLAADNGRIAALPMPLAGHIARHDPARVLREVEAKRAIVDVADRWTYGDEREAPDGHAVLRHLAAVYQDHPDYREEWRP